VRTGTEKTVWFQARGCAERSKGRGATIRSGGSSFWPDVARSSAEPVTSGEVIKASKLENDCFEEEDRSQPKRSCCCDQVLKNVDSMFEPRTQLAIASDEILRLLNLVPALIAMWRKRDDRVH
jgi:hypothetical protein